MVLIHSASKSIEGIPTRPAENALGGGQCINVITKQNTARNMMMQDDGNLAVRTGFCCQVKSLYGTGP